MAQQTNPERSHHDGFVRMMRDITANLVDSPGESATIPGSEMSVEALGFIKPDDTKEKPSHNKDMEYVPRPELDAKLETIEARMDGRLARIEDAVQRISEDNAATRAGISSLKATMIVTAIGAVLTIVLGVAAFNATLQSNMLSAFQVGQQTAATK